MKHGEVEKELEELQTKHARCFATIQGLTDKNSILRARSEMLEEEGERMQQVRAITLAH
jgi:hypothetical protein